MRRRPIRPEWRVDLPDGDPFESCHIYFTFRVNPFGLRRIDRVAADMRARPDLTVSLTIGRGLWWRNGRMLVTGPFYAIRPAADALKVHLTD